MCKVSAGSTLSAIERGYGTKSQLMYDLWKMNMYQFKNFFFFFTSGLSLYSGFQNTNAGQVIQQGSNLGIKTKFLVLRCLVTKSLMSQLLILLPVPPPLPTQDAFLCAELYLFLFHSLIFFYFRPVKHLYIIDPIKRYVLSSVSFLKESFTFSDLLMLWSDIKDMSILNFIISRHYL